MSQGMSYVYVYVYICVYVDMVRRKSETTPLDGDTLSDSQELDVV